MDGTIIAKDVNTKLKCGKLTLLQFIYIVLSKTHGNIVIAEAVGI